jgi:hypothetical protein
VPAWLLLRSRILTHKWFSFMSARECTYVAHEGMSPHWFPCNTAFRSFFKPFMQPPFRVKFWSDFEHALQGDKKVGAQ